MPSVLMPDSSRSLLSDTKAYYNMKCMHKFTQAGMLASLSDSSSFPEEHGHLSASLGPPGPLFALGKYVGMEGKWLHMLLLFSLSEGKYLFISHDVIF